MMLITLEGSEIKRVFGTLLPFLSLKMFSQARSLPSSIPGWSPVRLHEIAKEKL